MNKALVVLKFVFLFIVFLFAVVVLIGLVAWGIVRDVAIFKIIFGGN